MGPPIGMATDAPVTATGPPAPTLTLEPSVSRTSIEVPAHAAALIPLTVTPVTVSPWVVSTPVANVVLTPSVSHDATRLAPAPSLRLPTVRLAAEPRTVVNTTDSTATAAKRSTP